MLNYIKIWNEVNRMDNKVEVITLNTENSMKLNEMSSDEICNLLEDDNSVDCEVKQDLQAAIVQCGCCC